MVRAVFQFIKSIGPGRMDGDTGQEFRVPAGEGEHRFVWNVKVGKIYPRAAGRIAHPIVSQEHGGGKRRIVQPALESGQVPGVKIPACESAPK